MEKLSSWLEIAFFHRRRWSSSIEKTAFESLELYLSIPSNHFPGLSFILLDRISRYCVDLNQASQQSSITSYSR